MSSSVAIIMRAFNEMPHVRRTLEQLKRQTVQDFDLFAVDSGSTDGTREELQPGRTNGRLKTIAPADYIPGQVLNAAIADTDHEIIVLLNADAVPLSDRCLESLLQPLLAGEADAVFARQVARNDARFVVAYDYERAYNRATIAPDFFSAVACAFRRELWERHAFRETGYAEDLAWARSCMDDGARFRFVPEARVEHSHNYTLKQLYRKRYRQAVTFNQAPDLLRQTCRCLREIVRDLFHACRCLQFQTIPYNLAYRMTIYTAVYRGIRERTP